MSVKELYIPFDKDLPEEGVVPAKYCNRMETSEDYCAILDPRCPYINIGVGQAEGQSPIPFYANCRFHEDLEFIVRKELGEKSNFFCSGQFITVDGSSGFRVFQTLALNHSPSEMETLISIKTNIRLLLENINPGFLDKYVFIRRKNQGGIEYEWLYLKANNFLRRRI